MIRKDQSTIYHWARNERSYTIEFRRCIDGRYVIKQMLQANNRQANDEQLLKTYTPKALNTEVFELYVKGFRRFQGKPMVLFGRNPEHEKSRVLEKIKILYNGKAVSVNTPLKLQVEGVLIDDCYKRETWYVLVNSSQIMLNGVAIEAFVFGTEFTDEELYGLHELNMVEVPDLFDGWPDEFKTAFSTEEPFVFYARIIETLHMFPNVMYRTNRHCFEAIEDRIYLSDKESYLERVKTITVLNGSQQAWICKYPRENWKQYRREFFDHLDGISSNARGSKSDISLIFDKKYIKPDENSEYRVFWIKDHSGD